MTFGSLPRLRDHSSVLGPVTGLRPLALPFSCLRLYAWLGGSFEYGCLAFTESVRLGLAPVGRRQSVLLSGLYHKCWSVLEADVDLIRLAVRVDNFCFFWAAWELFERPYLFWQRRAGSQLCEKLVTLLDRGE